MPVDENRRRPQLKQEVNINLSSYMTLCISFIKQDNRRLYMKIGDRVRVCSSVLVYIHPEHKGQPFDIKDHEGEVINIINEWKGRPVSANLPILVKSKYRH